VSGHRHAKLAQLMDEAGPLVVLELLHERCVHLSRYALLNTRWLWVRRCVNRYEGMAVAILKALDECRRVNLKVD
jgi:hypothetical protein